MGPDNISQRGSALRKKPDELEEKLVKAIELKEIGFQELAAHLTSNPPENMEFDVNFEAMAQNSSTNDEFFRICVRCVVDGGEDCKITVEAFGQYRVTDPAFRPMSTKNAIRYANLVGALQIYPYIRQEVSSLSSKISGSPLTLPVLHFGELHFDEPE